MIDKRIAFYKDLNNEDRENYLNHRIRSHKNDGSTFPELKGQKEVLAKIDITPLEILGHYAGKLYNEKTYHETEDSMGASLVNIDRYSITTTPDKFISGFRFGNITTLINSCKTYTTNEKSRNLPEPNVLFIRHKDHQYNQGEVIVFLMSVTDIKAGDPLWLDYGESYWDTVNNAIDISDSE